MPTYNVTVTDSLFAHEQSRPNIKTALQDNSILHVVTPFAAYGLFLTSNTGFHDADSVHYQAGAAVVDLLKLHEVVTPTARYSRTINTPLLIHDALLRAFPVLLTSGFSVHDASHILQAVTVLDKLKLRESPGALARYAGALLERVKFQTASQWFLGGRLAADTARFHDSFLPVYQAVARPSERLALSSLLGGSLLFTMQAADNVILHDTDILKMIFKGDHLLDTLNIWAAYVDPGGGFTTWAINTRTSAVTEYQNYAFNSVCKFGHRYLGADATGLWTLDGELDDAMSIPTQIKSGLMQFAGSRFTSFKAAYLGLRVTDAASDFFLKLHAGDGRVYVYAVRPQNMQNTKVNMGKGLRSRYFAFELVTDGADYDLDSIEFVPISSKRRV